MGCHGGFSLDEATRRSWFNPEKVLKDAGLGLGMTFVDVGCGDGFFTILAAQIVGTQSRQEGLNQHKSRSGESRRNGFLRRMRRHRLLQHRPPRLPRPSESVAQRQTNAQARWKTGGFGLEEKTDHTWSACSDSV